MQIKFTTSETGYGPWKPGELLTVQIGEALADGSYVANTVETHPADIKAQVDAELAAANQEHVDALARVNAAHAADVATRDQAIEQLQTTHAAALEQLQAELASKTVPIAELAGGGSTVAGVT